MVLLSKIAGLLEKLSYTHALYVLAILATSIILLFLIYPTTYNSDSSFYSIPAYHLAYDGTLSNEPCNRFGGERTYWQPPLWFVLEAMLYKAVGYSYLVVNLLPLLIFVAFIIIAWKIVPKNNRIAAFCLLISLSVVNTAITNRPDVLMGLFSLLIVFSASTIIIGIAAGLALSTHSIGIPLALFALAKVAMGNLKELPLFLVIIGAINLPFALYILEAPNEFVLQFLGNNTQRPTLAESAYNALSIIVFLPPTLLLLLDYKKISKEKIFALMLLMYFIIGCGALSRHFRYGIIIAPFILSAIDYNKKSLISLVILANICILAFGLLVDVHAALVSDSIYKCISEYNLLNANNELCLAAEYFILNPSAPCASQCKKSIEIPRHLKYSGPANYTSLVPICKIEKFDYRGFGLSNYSFVIAEKND